ncbi:hypothetical protein D3C83_236620 [compost metagenome]
MLFAVQQFQHLESLLVIARFAQWFPLQDHHRIRGNDKILVIADETENIMHL